MHQSVSDRERLFALVLNEIRLRLASHLGSTCDSEPGVRHAAHLAYAVHNIALDALDALDEKHSDLQSAIKMIESADRMLGEDFASRVLDSDRVFGGH